MHQEYFQGTAPLAIQQQACTLLGHCGDLHSAPAPKVRGT
jgi:hypothetical protein